MRDGLLGRGDGGLRADLRRRPNPRVRSQRSGLSAIAKAQAARVRRALVNRPISMPLRLFNAKRAATEHDAIVRRYASTMGKLSTAYPSDHQAAIIYAMSLLKDGMPPDPDLTLTRKAALSILDGVLKVEPSNPGVLHFIIHATDNPRMGIVGAERGAPIRQARTRGSARASHAQPHLCAPRSLERGHPVEPRIQSGVGKNRRSCTPKRRPGCTQLDFLQYAYLQKGRRGQRPENDGSSRAG